MKTVLEHLTSERWRSIVEDRIDPGVILSLTGFLNAELTAQKLIYPSSGSWFRALNELEPSEVRVVILGQDPYHGPNQAQGLSFSVPESAKLPPSLRNIFKEQKSDLGIDNCTGDLSNWASQGVLLLNSVLTVEAANAASHAKKGWEQITDSVIQILSENEKHIVFMLWGGFAQKKSALIDESKHCVLTAAHPSPLSAHRGWFGSCHFSKANWYLEKHHQAPIDWNTSQQQQLSIL